MVPFQPLPQFQGWHGMARIIFVRAAKSIHIPAMFSASQPANRHTGGCLISQDVRPIDLVVRKHPGLALRCSPPFGPGRQAHEGVHVSARNRADRNLISVKSGNDRRIHRVGRAEIAIKEGPVWPKRTRQSVQSPSMRATSVAASGVSSRRAGGRHMFIGQWRRSPAKPACISQATARA